MFNLDADQLAKLAEWQRQNEPDLYSGAAGGRYTYHFTPTSLGMVVKVTDELKKIEIDLTDWSW